MSLRILNRRNFLIIAAGATSFLLPLSACKQNAIDTETSDSFSSSDKDVINLFVERLFPFPNLNPSVFSDITTDLFESAMRESGLRSNLNLGIQALQGATQGLWINSQLPSQIDVMKKYENEAWFSDILLRAKGVLFYHPNLWKHIGYGGSSIEEGGYRTRGFDDIDWLPVSTK